MRDNSISDPASKQMATFEPITTDEERRAALVTDICQATAEQAQSVLNWAIHTGEQLLRLRELCRGKAELWTSYFVEPVTPQKRRVDRPHLPFSHSKAHRLMAIASNPALREISHVKCSRLPNDWGLLYQLSRVEPKKLTKLIERGRVDANTTRQDATRLLPKKEKKPWSEPAAKNVNVNITDLRTAARQLHQHLDTQQIQELIELLSVGMPV